MSLGPVGPRKPASRLRQGTGTCGRPWQTWPGGGWAQGSTAGLRRPWAVQLSEQEHFGGTWTQQLHLTGPAPACRRAAHFANYAAAEEDEDGAAAGGNVHVGGSNARSLGMWSTTVELVNAREQARAARERQLLDGGGGADSPAGEAGAAAAQWVPSRDVALGPR